jgi:primosomal protein N' (replication factor Y)
MTRTIYQILLPLPFNEGFSYFAPDGLLPKIGDVVKVPFRSKELSGVVIDKSENLNNINEKKIKTIISKREDLTLSPKLLELINWVAAYNMAPKGLILKLTIAILNSAKEPRKKKAPQEKNLKININLKQLLPDQQKATDNLLEITSQQKFSTILLDGITGSGKTEIYFYAIASLLKQKEEKDVEQVGVCNPDLKFESSLKGNENPRVGVTNPDPLEAVNPEPLEAVNPDPLEAVNPGPLEAVNPDPLEAVNTDKLETADNQILILLPEIALTSQLCNRFEEQFGFKPDLWHSKITPSKKLQLFKKITNGGCKVLIGARSALFLPFKNLKLIVVDEEHDASFKQEDIVNYQARDMAIMRAKIENFPIILSSATPSLESYVNAKSKKYHLISLSKRFGQQEKTEIILLDLKKEKIKKNQGICEVLKNELEENLKNNKQSLLFLNRRGYAPLTLCKKCGHKITCSNCSSNPTFHQKINRLVCHHCGISKKLINICPNCAQEDCLTNCGIGVEKLKEEVLQYFPKARIGLMTSDVIKTIDQAENLVEQILAHKIDIIIGTQMIAKGHHFPSLALVGIIDGDGSFFNGQLRSAERSYQLLTQVIGRAGRHHYRGRVILQTYNPENIIFKKVIKGSKNEFLEEEIKARKAMNFPPFGKMAQIIFSGSDENLVVDFAKFVLKKFPINPAIEIFGPAPMPIARVKNRYYYRLTIKTDKKINLQNLIATCMIKVKTPSQIRVKIDVDPI